MNLAEHEFNLRQNEDMNNQCSFSDLDDKKPADNQNDNIIVPIVKELYTGIVDGVETLWSILTEKYKAINKE